MGRAPERSKSQLKKPLQVQNLPDNRVQSKLFIKTAREVEADEGGSASDELLGRLAKKPPEPRKPPK